MSNKSYYFYPKHGNVKIFYGKFGVVRKIETFMHESSFHYRVHVMQNAYL